MKNPTDPVSKSRFKVTPGVPILGTSIRNMWGDEEANAHLDLDNVFRTVVVSLEKTLAEALTLREDEWWVHQITRHNAPF